MYQCWHFVKKELKGGELYKFSKMSNKFSEKFVTMQRKPVTDETSREPVTDKNVTEDTMGKPVTTTYNPAAPD